jgi:hypothetical protein
MRGRIIDAEGGGLYAEYVAQEAVDAWRNRDTKVFDRVIGLHAKTIEPVEKSPEQQARAEGVGVNFERIRRITGYLVGTVDHFNNGKRAEEADRVAHDVPNTSLQSREKTYASAEARQAGCSGHETKRAGQQR